MYRVAILGSENSHADTFLKFVLEDKKYDDIEFIGVYSDDEAATQKQHDRFGVYVAKDYSEFVGKTDGLIVTARHGGNHYKYAAPYIKSGIPMFIDKPITICPNEAEKLMDELSASGVRFTGGSCCIHADEVQKLKQGIAEGEYGKIKGGFVRSPIAIDSVYGGIYFYMQHGVQIMTEIFGNNVVSVKAFRNGDVITVICRYPEFDVTLMFIDGSYCYYASVAGSNGMHNYDVQVNGMCFEREFDEFHRLLLGEAQKISRKDFIAPVYIMNAIDRSLSSGNEENV